MELIAAVALTNAVRGRIPYGAWRKAHYLTLPAWLLATGHGVLAGTDRLDPWFAAIAGGTVAAVVIAACSRFSRRPVRA